MYSFFAWVASHIWPLIWANAPAVHTLSVSRAAILVTITATIHSCNTAVWWAFQEKVTRGYQHLLHCRYSFCCRDILVYWPGISVAQKAQVVKQQLHTFFNRQLLCILFSTVSLLNTDREKCCLVFCCWRFIAVNICAWLLATGKSVAWRPVIGILGYIKPTRTCLLVNAL